MSKIIPEKTDLTFEHNTVPRTGLTRGHHFMIQKSQFVNVEKKKTLDPPSMSLGKENISASLSIEKLFYLLILEIAKLFID